MTNRYLSTLILLLCCLFSLSDSYPDSNQKKPTIAVLNFENKSTFDRLDTFEIALPYMLISDLSKISSIQLVERDKVDRLMAETELAEKDLMDSATMQRIGNVLGADVIIIGNFCEEVESGQSVEKSNLSITLNLKDVRTGKIIKKIQVEGKSKEFYILEKQLIESLTEVLKLRPAPKEMDSIRKIATRSLEAVIHFAKGKKLQHKAASYYGEKKYGREDQKKFLQEAVSCFKQALYLAPEYADAQFELTEIEMVTGLSRIQRVRYKERTINECEEFLKRFSGDHRCADILIKLGNIYSSGDQPYTDYDKAIACYRKSIFQYNYKGTAPVEYLIHIYYVFKGDCAEAIAMCRFLIEHYPNQITFGGLIPGKILGYYKMLNVYEHCEQYDKALDVLEYIEKNELFSSPYYIKKEWDECFPHKHTDDLVPLRKRKGDIYVKMGREDKAVAEWEGMMDKLRRLPENKWVIGGSGNSFDLQSFWYDLANAYSVLGKEDKAIHYFQEATNAPTDDPRQAIQAFYDLGKLYQKRGEWLKALKAYGKLLELGNPRREFVDKDMEICRKNLGIKKPQAVRHWLPYYLFPKSPKKVKIDEMTKKYIYEQYGSSTMVREKGDLYFALKYSRSAHYWHNKDGWGDWPTEEHGWFVCQANLSGEQKIIYKIPDGFEIKYITDIAVDDSNIWLASGNSGVIRFDRKNEKWMQYTTRDGLSHNTVWDIVVAPGSVWFGFGDKGRGGLNEYDTKIGEWRVHWHERISCAVTALAIEGNRLWAGVGDGTVAIFDLQDKSWKIMRGKEGYGFMGIHPMVKRVITSAPCSTIREIHIENGLVWFACSGMGVKKYDMKAGKWSKWKFEGKSVEGRLKRVEVLSLGIDGNTIWTGNLYDSGICTLNIKTGLWEKPMINLWRTNSIVVDNNVVWFAYSGGIMRFFKNGVENETD